MRQLAKEWPYFHMEMILAGIPIPVPPGGPAPTTRSTKTTSSQSVNKFSRIRRHESHHSAAAGIFDKIRVDYLAADDCVCDRYIHVLNLTSETR